MKIFERVKTRVLVSMARRVQWDRNDLTEQLARNLAKKFQSELDSASASEVARLTMLYGRHELVRALGLTEGDIEYVVDRAKVIATSWEVK